MKKHIKFLIELSAYAFAGSTTGILAMWAIGEFILTKIQ